MSALPPGGDSTPLTGAQTDVAPLGRALPPPPHEQTGGDSSIQWSLIAAEPEFRALLKAKMRFIVPATIFFVVYYFLLPISVGWFPALMKKEVLGHANWAYIFAFSQFIMAWVLAALYVRVAAGWDRRADALLKRLGLH